MNADHLLIVQELQATINRLRAISQQYTKLADPEKIAVRHLVYQKTGKFGRLLLENKGELLESFKEEENNLINKGK